MKNWRTHSDDRAKEIAALAESGMVASAIAERFGITRNAVLGLLFRMRRNGIKLNLPRKPRTPKPAKVKREAAPKPETTLKVPPLRRADIVLIGPRVGEDIPDAGCCKFIEGPVHNGQWCGQPVAGAGGLGQSYCEGHRHLCVSPLGPKINLDPRPSFQRRRAG